MQKRAVAQAPRTNRLLAALPADELARVRPHLERIDLPIKMVLYESNKPIEHAYFVHRGVASLVGQLPPQNLVEVATVGPEGMVGLPLVLGDDRASGDAFMQVPGDGARIETAAFRKLLPQCPAFQRLLMRYALALIAQISQNVACNRAHTVEERAARWLLMTHDRVHEATFTLTQEFLGQMLGVRRPTVSLAASMLARAGLIDYVRGQVEVLDRDGLERAACDCYRIITDEFDRLVGGDG